MKKQFSSPAQRSVRAGAQKPNSYQFSSLNGFMTIVALAGLLFAHASDCSAGVALFDGTNDTIRVNGDLVLGNSATYEARVLFTQSVTNFASVFNEWTFAAEDKFLVFEPGPILLGYSFPVHNYTPLRANVTLSLNQWHHIAYVYDGAEERLYLDGLVLISRASSGSMGNSSGKPFIGAIFRGGGVEPSFIGYIDTLRISKTARYSGTNFAAPTGDLSTDGNTLLLYNFDEVPGSTTTADLSGNGHTGTLGVGFAGATSPQFTFDPEPPGLGIASNRHLMLRAPIGSTNRIEYVFTVGATNWETLTNLVVQQSPLQVIDPQFGQVSQKFYRAVRLP